MKYTALNGKTIARVHTFKFGRVLAIAAIEFTDGSFLRFSTLEGAGEYATEGIYPARPIEPATTAAWSFLAPKH